jgi:hypothetical protein
MKLSEFTTVQRPSFPETSKNTPLDVKGQRLWEVVCGDTGHWRAGIYSPDASAFDALKNFEQHSCPEFFMLLSGNISLTLIKNGKLETINLEPMKPVLVDTWHSAFCPKGKYTGTALVVERDEFTTEYKTSAELMGN